LRVRLAESVAGLSEKYPDVPVTQDLARGLVDQCLADRTPDAELLVVGRADVRGWSRFLHVSCAMAVLERAHTTVAVVPETYRGDEGR
jgi:nucleotide-binding universal stress UspA family protein